MEVIVNAKGQIVIPATVRRKFNLQPETSIQIEVDEAQRRIILTPITCEYVHSLRGRLKGTGALHALITDRQREREL